MTEQFQCVLPSWQDMQNYAKKTADQIKKSGFVPPFATWLTDRNFNHRVRDILMKRNASVSSIVPRKIFDELLSDALDGRKLRFPILNFLWGALFTEMWLEKYK